MRFSISHKILALVLLPLLLSLSIMIVLASMLKQAEAETNRESHSSAVKIESSLISVYADNATKALTNFVALHDQLYLEAARDAASSLQRELDILRPLVEENNFQKQSFQTVAVFCDQLTAAIALAQSNPEAVRKQLPGMWQSTIDVSVEFKKMNVFESRFTTDSVAVRDQRRALFRNVLVTGAFLNIAAALYLGLFAVRPIVRRLRVLNENNARLAKRSPLLPPIEGNDEIARLDASFHIMADALTEHIRKEESIVANVNDIICSLDRELTFIRINKACFDVLGYLPEELSGRKFEELLHPSVAANVVVNVKDIVARKSSDRFEAIMRCKDGTQCALQWAVHWSDVDAALFCVVHDVTEMKRLEKMKQDFVAMVSHDLRTPLTSLQSAFELVEDGTYGDLSQAGRKAARTSQRNISSLIGLINEILDIEKIESGMFALAQRMTSLDWIFERAVELIGDLADARKVHIVMEPTDMEAFVDSDRLQQVIINLLSNAIKYSPPDGRVTLQTERTEGNMIKVSVTDEGQGVPEKMREAIFDRFQQVSHSDWKVKGGSGLGLAICKSLVEAHGGQIAVMSAPQRGSTFWFTIPSAPP